MIDRSSLVFLGGATFGACLAFLALGPAPHLAATSPAPEPAESVRYMGVPWEGPGGACGDLVVIPAPVGSIPCPHPWHRVSFDDGAAVVCRCPRDGNGCPAALPSGWAP